MMSALDIYERLTRQNGALLRIVGGKVRPYFLFTDSLPVIDWDQIERNKAELIELIEAENIPMPECIRARPDKDEDFELSGGDLADVIMATCTARGHPLIVGNDGALIIADALPDALHEAITFNSELIAQAVERNNHAST